MIVNQEQFLFESINIIGVGLIGGSIAKACKKNNVAKFISGFDTDKNMLDMALSTKVVDGLFSFKEDIADNNLIIIAAPLFSYEEIFKKLADKINNAVVIDIGSLKGFVLGLAKDCLQNKANNFVACHPIAGSDKSGVLNANSQLFSGKKVIITPDVMCNQEAIKKVELFWERIGANVDFIDAKEHDKIFGLVSHLPQFLSFMAFEDLGQVLKNGDDEILNKHFRLQNSNPKIWQEIFALNKENLKHYIEFYLKNIDEFLKNQNIENGLIARRKALVSCFLNLPDIANFRSFGGLGFQDFTSIINHQKEAFGSEESTVEFLNQIKLKIQNYGQFK